MRRLSGPDDIVKFLANREGRQAEARIAMIRTVVLVLALVVYMPIRAVFSQFQLDASFWFDLGIFGLGMGGAGAIALLLRMRLPHQRIGFAAVLLDYGILAATMTAHALCNMVTAAGQSTAIFDLTLTFAFVFNLLNAIRLSRGMVYLSSFCNLALVAGAFCLDWQFHQQPLNAALVVLFAILTIASTLGGFFMVQRTRALIGEAAKLEQEAAHVKGVLSRYVSEQVAETILGKDFNLGVGRRQRVTLMFTDIRGFTHMSERMLPEEVVQLLNSYFSRMVETLFANDGMLDKYIGDGMMAIFGAPVPSKDHAEKAVRAALQMRHELKAFNEERVAAGHSPIKIGIGIHTGECVIGNIGSERRLDYTAIGDAVNTASRIEGLTKEHGADILISAETYAELKDLVRVRHLPEVELRGKLSRQDLYIVEGLVSEAKTPENRQSSGTNPLSHA